MAEGPVQEQPRRCWLPPSGAGKGLCRSLKQRHRLQEFSDPREAKQSGGQAGEQWTATGAWDLGLRTGVTTEGAGQ